MCDKPTSWEDMIKNAKERDSKYKCKKERIDHDLIAYGVSKNIE
ncbi:MAG: hypothetical protein ABIJ10_07720 [Candidatus Micrarchaeota archaeon]